MRDLKTQLLPTRGGQAKDLHLFRLLPVGLFVPPLWSLELRKQSLAVGHVSPRGPQAFESWLQLLGVPSELLEVPDRLQEVLPLRHRLSGMLPAKFQSLLHPSRS